MQYRFAVNFGTLSTVQTSIIYTSAVQVTYVREKPSRWPRCFYLDAGFLSLCFAVRLQGKWLLYPRRE